MNRRFTNDTVAQASGLRVIAPSRCESSARCHWLRDAATTRRRDGCATRNHQRGVALVITLVMLAVVTLMAVVFLAMSRRQRSSVKVYEDMATSQALANAALEQAKSKAIARMVIEGSKLHYDLFDSTNYIAPSFNQGQALNGPPNPLNVSYVDNKGRLLSGSEYLRMLANMQYDARPPVYVETNRSGAGEFRFYLDFNRNRTNEPNGLWPVLDDKGNPIRDARRNVVYSTFVGDPDWVGVLERPDLPHSETNRFIGRFAYLVLPAGKSLDLNYIHNQADRTGGEDSLDKIQARNGFNRNQGVGSWELNLAGFFRDLNTNNYAWHSKSYLYRPALGQPSKGEAFDDARAILAYRYRGRRQFLARADFTLGPFNFENPGNGNAANFRADFVDEYSDGPMPKVGARIFLPAGTLLPDDDNPALPWPGSLNTNAFTDIQQLFHLDNLDPGLTNRLEYASTHGKSSYDRYTFYRLAAQLGADSTPALKGKIHLNFQNAVGQITNTFVPWTNAVTFFTNAADLMLKACIDGVVIVPTNKNAAVQAAIIAQYNRAPGTYYQIGDTLVRTNFSITNIQVYAPFNTNFPFSVQNEYTPTIHRILQVAANIYDNMTNKGSQYPYYPTVFQPMFTKTATNLIISGFLELTNISDTSITKVPGGQLDLANLFATARTGFIGPTNVFGQHLVIGVKKGLPNINEIALDSHVEVSRKLELTKTAVGQKPSGTNEMFLVSINNHWGTEAWNSYTNRYPRPVGIKADIVTRVVVRDGTNYLTAPIVYDTTYRLTSPERLVANWSGANWFLQNPTNFVIPLEQTLFNLRDQAYENGKFVATNIARFSPLQRSPQFTMYTTNKVQLYIRDRDRLVDFVSLDNLVTVMNLTTNLYSIPSSINNLVSGGKGTNANAQLIADMMWDPRLVGGGFNPVLTAGITNQIAASTGDLDNLGIASVWKDYRFNDRDRDKSIALFRRFMGLPLRSIDTQILANSGEPLTEPADLRHQAPFTPTRLMVQTIKWQANDPLVHYMAQDLTHAPTANDTDLPRNVTPGVLFTNYWNIGALNGNYRPWGGNPGKVDSLAYNIGVKDPMQPDKSTRGISTPDQWDFPISSPVNRTNYFFPNIGALGQVHRGTPWQTIYLKSIYRFTTNGIPVPLVDPATWLVWSGSEGTYPSQDWKLLDVFTAAPNESAARGLLSVNQTNQAAWSAVLSGVMVATNIFKNPKSPVDPTNAYVAAVIDPASPQLATIVRSINFARTNQWEIVPNRNLALRRQYPWEFVMRTNKVAGAPVSVFEHVGDVLGAPHLSVQSPFLYGDTFGTTPASVRAFQYEWTDRAVEYIPSQILSLLQRDEPRFVVYAFGQSLRPAPHSLSSDPNFYHICTNYQVSGEVIAKATFRIEGDLPDASNPLTQNNPLHAVVESYQILPPPD